MRPAGAWASQRLTVGTAPFSALDAPIGRPVNREETFPSTSNVPRKSLTNRLRKLFPFHPVEEVPKADAAFNRCRQVVQGSAEFWSSARRDHFVNWHQCDFLVQKLKAADSTLAAMQQSPLLSDSTIPVLEELHRFLCNADTLMRRSYITGTNVWLTWLRAATEQGDLKETFSHLIYDIQWCTYVLQCILLENSKESSIKFDPNFCDYSLSASDELALMTGMKMDEEKLRRIMNNIVLGMNFITFREGTFASRLFAKLESNSPYLVVLTEEDIDLEGGVIGRGGYGSVRSSKFLGIESAVKIIGLTSHEKELEAIAKLGNHPYVVRHFCYSKSDHEVYLVMERLDKDLETALGDRSRGKQPLSLEEAVSLMLQIGEGMKYMHGKGVAHRDLKPSNILIKLEKSGRSSRICSVKIADFGSTKAAERTETNTAHTGTTKYMAPEVMKAKGDPEKARLNLLKADVYSFAITSIHILTGKYPYAYNNPEIIERSKAGERPLFRYELPNCPLRLATLLTKCWSHIPSERPQFTEICRELRYIKGLLLKGDEQKLQTLIPSTGPPNLLGSVKLEGPWGNSGYVYGQEFCDIASSIKKIELGYNDHAIEGIFKVAYNILGKTILKSYLRDSPTSEALKFATIEFQPDEFIKQISVYSFVSRLGSMNALKIYTNFQIYGPFGEEHGTKFTSDTGSRVIGFHGNGGVKLYNLGVVTVPDV